MEIHQLRYFLAVVDARSFSAAAETLHISQSGVSAQVQKLERELGLELIDRSTRRMSPTPAGARLAERARAALAAVEQVSAAANELRGLVVGTLRVATVTGLAWPPLYDALASLHSEHPGLDIRLNEGTSAELLTGLHDGVIDVAVAAWSGAPPAGLQNSIVFDDALVAVVAPSHPWAARSAIRPAELATAELIALPTGTGARAALDALLSRVGTTSDPRWEVSAPAYVQLLASRGLGIGIVSSTTARDWRDLIALPIRDKAARSQLGIVWRPGPSHPAQALLRQLPQPTLTH